MNKEVLVENAANTAETSTNSCFGIIVTITLLLILMLVFRLNYMNCNKIVIKHIKNFMHNGRILKIPFFIFFIFPLFIAFGLAYFKVIDDGIANNIVVIFSILMSMLFTLLVLIIDIKSRIENANRDDGGRADRLNELILETYSTLMYEILVAIITLILSFVYYFSDKLDFIVSFIIFYLVFNFMFNLFMLLKRIYTIIEVDLEK